jgi:hypothetical protein
MSMLYKLQPGSQRAGGAAAECCVEDGAAAVAERCPEISADIVAQLIREMPELKTGGRDVSLLAASVEETVAMLLHALEHGIERSAIEAPATPMEYGRRLAQRGVPVVTLERAYRISLGCVLERCCEELGEGGADGPTTAGAALRITKATFAYMDRVAEQVVAAYAAERALWASSRGAAHAEQVAALLAGEDVDVDAAELTLGYRLRRRHLGAVVWLDEADNGADELALLDRVVSRLAERVGTVGAPLFVARDGSSAWAWLPLASGQSLPEDGFELSAADVEHRARVSLGDPEDHVDGFGRTHRQALRVQAVALAAGPVRRRVTAFAQIRPVALMSADLDATREWVRETLGPLALDTVQNARLRETVRIYLSAGGYTAAAARLTVHTNTVHYRVQKAEEARGRPIPEDRLELELALLACHWLGAAVLQPAPE